MNPTTLKRLVLSALFLSLALILPFFTGQIPQIGSALLPMHLPIFLCGATCGWIYGGAVGLIAPLLRSFMFGMPPLFPTAIAMSLELATYGIVIGALYVMLHRHKMASFWALLGSMVVGRIVWGGVTLLLLGVNGGTFTWAMFVSGALVTAVPGILSQLVLVPLLLAALKKAGLLNPFLRKSNQPC